MSVYLKKKYRHTICVCFNGCYSVAYIRYTQRRKSMQIRTMLLAATLYAANPPGDSVN